MFFISIRKKDERRSGLDRRTAVSPTVEGTRRRGGNDRRKGSDRRGDEDRRKGKYYRLQEDQRQTIDKILEILEKNCE